MSVLDKLRGGDLRSISRSNEIVADIEENPTLIEKVFPGLYDPDPVLKARSADVTKSNTEQTRIIIKAQERNYLDSEK